MSRQKNELLQVRSREGLDELRPTSLAAALPETTIRECKRMTSNTPVRPERTTIGGSLEIPRMLNGLWQLAGGHDKDVNIANASGAMDVL